MRIVQTSHHYYPHTGGTERVVKILVDGLARLKNEVHVFSDSEDLKGLIHQDNVTAHGISLKRIGKFRFPQRNYWKQIQNIHSDVVHIQGQRVWSSDYLYRKLHRISAKKVFTAHGFYQLTFGGKSNHIYYHRFMPSFLSKFHKIISLTEYEANITRSLAPQCVDKIIVIPDPVDMDLMDSLMYRENAQLPADLVPGQFVLHSGGLQRNKNIEDVIKSMVGRNTKLVLTGNLPDEAYWKFLLDLSNRKGVHMVHLGNVDDQLLYDLMRNCSHYISASKFESFGMSMIEAAYMGASVIAYEAGVAGELSKMGILKIADGPEGIGRSMDSFRRSDNVDQTRENLKKRYDSKKVVKAINDLYEDMLNE